MGFLDFELKIGKRSGLDYPVEVVHSPAGEREATMRFPYDELERESRLKNIEIALLKSSSTRRDMIAPVEEQKSAIGHCAQFVVDQGKQRVDGFVVAFTRRTPSFLVVMLFLTSLVTTGCDVIDSNGPLYDETISAEARYATNRSIRWITPVDELEVFPSPHEAQWPVSQLVGTWQLATADIQAPPEGSIPPTITFREDLIFTGYGECYNFSGSYRAGSDGHLTVTDFRSYQKFCVEEYDPIRDALFGGLQEATDFRFEQGTLWIISRGGKRELFFIFERIEEDTGEIGMPPAAGQ